MIRWIDLSRLVAGEALPFESVAFEKGLELHTDIANGIYMDGNSAQLKQLTSILLDNATRHSASGGEVCLTLTKAHGLAQLCVINPGEEIPAEQREQIFDRFYRMDPPGMARTSITDWVLPFKGHRQCPPRTDRGAVPSRSGGVPRIAPHDEGNVNDL